MIELYHNDMSVCAVIKNTPKIGSMPPTYIDEGKRRRRPVTAESHRRVGLFITSR